MPRSSDTPKTVERTLDSRVIAVYDAKSKWLALVLLHDGPTLNLQPESMQRLRDYLNDPKPAKSAVISELYTAEIDDGWLALVLPVRHYDFSELATQRLKAFLNELPMDQENPTDAH